MTRLAKKTAFQVLLICVADAYFEASCVLVCVWVGGVEVARGWGAQASTGT